MMCRGFELAADILEEETGRPTGESDVGDDWAPNISRLGNSRANTRRT